MLFRSNSSISSPPFNLDAIGLTRLDILSSASITRDEIAWLQLDSPVRAATPDGRVVLGIAPCLYDTGIELLGLAITNGDRSLFVDCASWHAAKDVAHASLDVLDAEVLTSDKVLCVGFDLANTLIGIRRDFGKEAVGVDVSSAGVDPGEEVRPPVSVAKAPSSARMRVVRKERKAETELVISLRSYRRCLGISATRASKPSGSATLRTVMRTTTAPSTRRSGQSKVEGSRLFITHLDPLFPEPGLHTRVLGTLPSGY